MSSKLSDFLRKWMLVLSMLLGVGIYLFLRFVPGFGQAELTYSLIAKESQPFLVGIMLFLQFNVTAPSDLHVRRWHAEVLSVQALLFAVFTVVTILLPHGELRILSECAMLCFICPTASAAGVITSRIGGSLQQTMAYLLLSDIMATLLIPLVVPLINPQEGLSYFGLLWSVSKRVFSMLVLPCILAWTIRYTLPKVQKWFASFVNYAFYVWGIALLFAISLATRSLVLSHSPFYMAFLIGLVALACCIGHFLLGRRIARRYGHSISITAGQTFGQKNTGFLIWLGINYMTPITSVAGGLYSIWQNLVNSWELQHYKSKNS
jgi:BASS family bile acid:Na+ symporter